MNDPLTTRPSPRLSAPARPFHDTRILAAALAPFVGLACAQPPPATVSGMFRGGPEHRGVYSATTTASGHGKVEWAFPTRGPIRGTPLVIEDQILVGSGDGFLYAIDRDSAHERWRFRAAGPIHSSPALDAGLVFFADRTNTFYAIDYASGRLRWQVTTGADKSWEWGHEGWDYYISSPALAAGLVIFGSGDGHVYALEAASGAERWRVATGGRVRSSPAVSGGVAYVGSADGFLYAIDIETGDVLWKFATEGASLRSSEFGFDRKTIQSSPAVADGVVYFGARDGHMYAVDGHSGTQLWRYDHQISWVISSPAVRAGSIYAGSSDGQFVHSLTSEGGEAWRFAAGNRVFSSPSLSGETVYAGVHSGRFLALDAASGALEWELRFGSAIMSSAVIADDHVYFGCDDGRLYAVRLFAGSPPRRAVYWDDERTAWTTLAGHERLRDYFQSRGYQVVDRHQLAEFMRSALNPPLESVVVFAMDDLPPTVAPTPSDSVLVRRYLEAGGKVVWLGLPPLFLERGPDGTITGVERGNTSALLEVDHGRYDFDQYPAYPTEAGRRWGLSDWRIGMTGVDSAAVTRILALDERGGASAWVETYGGRPGSGFVSLWGSYRPIEPRFYDQIRRVAEYGIGVVADSP